MQWRSFPITAHSLNRPGWLVSAIWDDIERDKTWWFSFNSYIWIYRENDFNPPGQFATACQGCCVLFCGGSFPGQWPDHLWWLLLLQLELLHPAASSSSFSPSSASAVAPTFSYGNAATLDAPPVQTCSKDFWNISQARLENNWKRNKINEHTPSFFLTCVFPIGGGGPKISLQDWVSSTSWDSTWLSSPCDDRFRFVLIRMAGCKGFAGIPKSSMSAAWPASRGWWATWEKKQIYLETSQCWTARWGSEWFCCLENKPVSSLYWWTAHWFSFAYKCHFSPEVSYEASQDVSLSVLDSSPVDEEEQHRNTDINFM